MKSKECRFLIQDYVNRQEIIKAFVNSGYGVRVEVKGVDSYVFNTFKEYWVIISGVKKSAFSTEVK